MNCKWSCCRSSPKEGSSQAFGSIPFILNILDGATSALDIALPTKHHLYSSQIRKYLGAKLQGNYKTFLKGDLEIITIFIKSLKASLGDVCATRRSDKNHLRSFTYGLILIRLKTKQNKYAIQSRMSGRICIKPVVRAFIFSICSIACCGGAHAVRRGMTPAQAWSDSLYLTQPRQWRKAMGLWALRAIQLPACEAKGPPTYLEPSILWSDWGRKPKRWTIQTAKTKQISTLSN